MQEQQYGKTDLSRKQINICFSCIDVENETSTKNVCEHTECARSSSRGRSLNVE